MSKQLSDLSHDELLALIRSERQKSHYIACNYWMQPLGCPGCICQVVNKHYDQFLQRLRSQNQLRSEKWTGGADTAEFKAVELAGETGELMNAIKKQIRFQQGWKGGVDNTENLADEFGDVLICLDRLADAFGIDLASVTAAKFNKTSEKHGFAERL